MSKLKRLVYGMTGKIVVETLTDPETLIRQIEEVKSAFSIKGFIFRPSFAKDVEMADYTSEDWKAMLAQYATTYGWSHEYTQFFGEHPVRVLNDYHKDNDEFEPIYADNHKFSVEPEVFLIGFLKDILESPTVLRQNQIDCVEAAPMSLLEKVLDMSTIKIKETEAIVANQLIASGSTYNFFKDIDQIVRYFALQCEVDGQLSREKLSMVKFTISTKNRKYFLDIINNLPVKDTLTRMKKYTQFHKRLIKQLTWCSKSKMEKRYPKVMAIRDTLYHGKIITNESLVRRFQVDGNYRAAFVAECNNTGQMLRNLLQYLRYPSGSIIASKVNAESSNIVYTDFGENYAQEHFKSALKHANRKLLHQILLLIREDKWHRDITRRLVNGVEVEYMTPLPALDPTLTQLAKKEIKRALRALSEPYTTSLGKVYIDPSCKDYTIPFSGHGDSSLSVSGEYYAPGSTIRLPKKNDMLLRLGIAWRGTSCDLDLSTNLNNGKIVYYGSPTYKNRDGDVIISSSGDITSCGNDEFSIEFIDIDLEATLKHGVNEMFSSLIAFSGTTLDSTELETYFFAQYIPREQRVIKSRYDGTPKITMKLDQMDFAIKVNVPSKAALGVLLNIRNNTLKVLNCMVPKVGSGRSASGLAETFEKTMNSIPKQLNAQKALTLTIPSKQIVDTKEEADTCYGAIPGMIHPGTNMPEILKVVF